MVNQDTEKSLSKMMTKLLRHAPEDYGLALAPEDGSCPIDSLLKAIQGESKWTWVKQEDVEQVVRNSDKQRFEIANGRIRARYGHSHDKVRYAPAQPPAVLFHGTNKNALPSILEQGIRPMNRQYVHLSEGTHFATLAGSRRGELVILQVDTTAAQSFGVVFYYAGNEVWLSDEVPPSCCSMLNPREEEHSNE